MAKIGDKKTKNGIETTVTNIDPETGQITWSVEYAPDYLKLFKEITEMLETAKDIAQVTGDPFFKDHYNDVRKLRNQLRTYLRNNKTEEYERIKSLKEMGGTGAQYATPYAFGKKPTIYYYKLGYKPVDTKKLRKQAKGIEVKDLWNK